jgi:hypothetical protein
MGNNQFQLNQFIRISLMTLVLIIGFQNLFKPKTAFGRDMSNRLGVGYNSQFGNSTNTGIINGGSKIPGVSLKYGLTKEFAFEAIFGVATTSPSQSVTALKFFKNIFYESYLNFYFLIGSGFISGNGYSGIQFLTGFGVEFFFPNLESLGFSIETGASYDNSTGTYALKTIGFNFLDAGIHFYF